MQAPKKPVRKKAEAPFIQIQLEIEDAWTRKPVQKDPTPEPERAVVIDVWGNS